MIRSRLGAWEVSLAGRLRRRPVAEYVVNRTGNVVRDAIPSPVSNDSGSWLPFRAEAEKKRGEYLFQWRDERLGLGYENIKPTRAVPCLS